MSPKCGSLPLNNIRRVTNAESELRIAAVAFESREAMVVTDAQFTILRSNIAFTELTGYSADEVVGRTSRILKSKYYSDDFFREMWRSINSTGSWKGESWDRRKSGHIYPIWLMISSVRDDSGNISNYIATGHDITERKVAETRINHLVYFDQLTGLPNRTLLREQLTKIVSLNKSRRRFGALLCIDLDHFKNLNDSLGHSMGDKVLVHVARRLDQCTNECDIIGRLGGDEFAIIMDYISDNSIDATDYIKKFCLNIIQILSKPYQIDSISYSNTASIGVTLLDGDEISIDNVIKQADLAMYKSKNSGRNCFRIFNPEMEYAAKARAALEQDLVVALALNQFALQYQAQIVGKNKVCGAEVLLRWIHPVRGVVSPSEFIGIAEDTGLILKIGCWVLQMACIQLAKWASQDHVKDLTIAVNVSALQFKQSDFVERVLEVLNATGANPRRLKLEITESIVIDNVRDIIEKMILLKSYGVGFSMDDFGTGYSSLSCLKSLPIDQLKIDQSFVREVLVDPNDASIAKAIVALAENLGLTVIAEGVESVAQRDFLECIGCYSYQGYLYSRPVDILQFENYVAGLVEVLH